MAGTAVAANLPCGAWREHTRKFSPHWFLAVHATIPFVASLRKAVLMPKWAILLTVAASSESGCCWVVGWAVQSVVGRLMVGRLPVPCKPVGLQRC